MKANAKFQMAEAGNIFWDHINSEPIVSLMHSQSDIRSLATTEKRIPLSCIGVITEDLISGCPEKK